MKDKNQLKLTYNQADSKICLETYDEGFFNQSIDITDEVVELVRDKRDKIIKILGEIK